MRKVAILLVAVMLIGMIAAAGCTARTDNNQIVRNSTNSTNTKNTTHTTTAVKATLKLTPTPTYPTYIPPSTPTPSATPSVTPTPTPKPLCTHIDILVYHPLNSPCMMCSERYGTLSPYAQQHSPYVTASFVSVDNSTWSASTVRISATVRETGVSMSWDAYHGEPEVMAWCDSHLTCK
jgi:hypothetical protein